jgi:TonB family protein
MSRLEFALCLTLLVSPWLAAQQGADTPPWVKIPPQVAATHLLKKVTPPYPAFARAAGIEGVVRIEIGIYQDGRIRSIGVKSGPPCLSKAAINAVLQYIYKPFEKEGRLVRAETTVDVVFKLPDQKNAFRPDLPPENCTSVNESSPVLERFPFSVPASR